jgi:transcriptional regulator with XRE-family HTH domain
MLAYLTYSGCMSDSQAIGERIRLARQARGLTQEQLAEAVGVTRSAVAQWETGRAGQVTGNLSRIAAVLAVGVEHLMFGDDKAAPLRATRGDELAILRLYRDCAPADQQLLLRTARRLVAR